MDPGQENKADSPVLSHCSLLRSPQPKPTGVLEHCRSPWATMGPSSGETNCVYATLGTCHPVWMTGIQGGHPAYQSSIQSDKYQVSHRYSYFSW